MENNGLNKLTSQARRESYSLNHDYIGSEHLLLALMKTGSLASEALIASGANYDLFRLIVINNIGRGSSQRPATEFSKKVRQIFEEARNIALVNKIPTPREEDVLMAIINDDDSFTNLMFLLSGLDKESVGKNLKKLMVKGKTDKVSGLGLSENVSKFTTNLNEMARLERLTQLLVEMMKFKG